jgi:arylsulfatase A-like enzyme
MVQEVDKGVAAILSVLKETGAYRNTIVVFCSDNGATALGSNGSLRGLKGTNFEGGHRVPCVVQWPGQIRKGSRSNALLMSMDFMPTLLDCSGSVTSPGRDLDGMTMRGIWKGESGESARTVMWNGTTLRQGDWKLMLPQKGLKIASLFNLKDDPSESTNVIAQYPEQTQILTDILNTMSKDTTETATSQPTKSPE